MTKASRAADAEEAPPAPAYCVRMTPEEAAAAAREETAKALAELAILLDAQKAGTPLPPPKKKTFAMPPAMPSPASPITTAARASPLKATTPLKATAPLPPASPELLTPDRQASMVR